MIPSGAERGDVGFTVYQRGVVIDSQHALEGLGFADSISKGSGD